ncbi:hypothetical protein Pint_13744 [Pistacia integerrima]|uniref:Uncharacterized protein n=1 Tax=Pistacia integerrima TaxID=434235 RepID=A0ACC0Y875_9ROSI|nr:hypothetical protein Pint_13744 [Pistacia integerrima]
MGWTSTGDPYANAGDAFDSEETAKAFAERHGQEAPYTIAEGEVICRQLLMEGSSEIR